MGRRKTLTKSEVQNLRANIMRTATQLANRLSDNALGKLDTELSAGQIKSIVALLGSVLPAQQSVAWSDETENTRTAQDMAEELQAMRQQLISELTPDEISQVIGTAH